MLGDFHINLQLPLSHIRQSQIQQGIVREIIQQFGPTQIVLFELPGEIGTPKRCVLAMCVSRPPVTRGVTVTRTIPIASDSPQ
jgi:hypothetical protein